MSDLDARAVELRAARVPFVHARVVLAERPTSAKPGDQALVLADGTMEGFVGGACAESTVRAQGLAVLDSGLPLLLRISPTPEAGQAGKLVVHNPCLSGGTLEIFLEPVRPVPLVLVAGEAPIARALVALGRSLGYDIASYASDALTDAAAVVVASHGSDEESVLSAALAAGVPYVGLVASRKRGEAVLASLGLCPSVTARVRTPAGLDIGARTAEEVALSILAEIVASRPRPSGHGPVEGASSGAAGESPVPAARGMAGPGELGGSGWGEAGGSGRSDAGGPGPGVGSGPATAVDPVCHMTVAMVEASLHLDHDSRRYWFCGSGCLRAFADNPSAYL